MAKYKTIAVIYGSDSSESEVSCRSGEFVASRLDGSMYDIYEVFARFGKWSLVAYKKKDSMRVIRSEEAYTRSGFRSDITVMTCDRCDGCPFREKCVVTKNKNREIHRKLGNIREERKAKARLDLPENQRKLKRRSLEPEPVFGQLKHNHSYTRFRHFGKAKVTMDLGFILMALNILKLHRNIRKSA